MEGKQNFDLGKGAMMVQKRNNATFVKGMFDKERCI